MPDSKNDAGKYTTFIFDDKYVKAAPATIGEWRAYPQEPEPAYTIRVFEDLAKPAKPYMKRHNLYDHIFDVHVPKKEADLEEPNGRGSLLASWLHELGHVVAQIFNLPAARKDPRSYSSFYEDFSAPVYERMYDSEVEAWELGEAMYHFSLYSRRCLDSYCKLDVKRFVDDREKP